MRARRLALAFLIVAAVGAGLAARVRVSSYDPYAQALRGRDLARQLSAYAPNAAASDVAPRSDVDLRPLEIFYSALQHLRDEYVEPIQKPQGRELAYGALRLMLDSLHDPLTRFLDPEQAQLVQEARAGRFHGIGAVIAVRQTKEGGVVEERLVVVSALPDSPARKAGLLAGDVITELDGKTILPYDPLQRVEKLIKASRNGLIEREKKLPKLLEIENQRIKNGIGFQKAADMLASKSSKDFTLTIARRGVKSPLKVKVGVGETVVAPVTYSALNSSVGYVHFNLLTEAAGGKFAEAIADFKRRGLKGMVLDLRDCPGGAIESVQEIAGNLIPDKPLAILELPRGKQRTLRAGAPSKSGPWTGPVAVIVNGGTVGASEVLGAAIRDGAAARLVGDRTFGGNLQETLVPLRDGSAVSMTTGKYLTPKGADYRGEGLTPDVVVPAGSAPPGEDAQLARAVRALAAGKGKG